MPSHLSTPPPEESIDISSLLTSQGPSNMMSLHQFDFNPFHLNSEPFVPSVSSISSFSSPHGSDTTSLSSSNETSPLPYFEDSQFPLMDAATAAAAAAAVVASSVPVDSSGMMYFDIDSTTSAAMGSPLPATAANVSGQIDLEGTSGCTVGPVVTTSGANVSFGSSGANNTHNIHNLPPSPNQQLDNYIKYYQQQHQQDDFIFTLASNPAKDMITPRASICSNSSSSSSSSMLKNVIADVQALPQPPAFSNPAIHTRNPPKIETAGQISQVPRTQVSVGRRRKSSALTNSNSGANTNNNASNNTNTNTSTNTSTSTTSPNTTHLPKGSNNNNGTPTTTKEQATSSHKRTHRLSQVKDSAQISKSKKRSFDQSEVKKEGTTQANEKSKRRSSGETAPISPLSSTVSPATKSSNNNTPKRAEKPDSVKAESKNVGSATTASSLTQQQQQQQQLKEESGFVSQPAQSENVDAATKNARVTGISASVAAVTANTHTNTTTTTATTTAAAAPAAKPKRKRTARRRLTVHQKIAHNKIEKKYRTNINEKIFGLQDLMPISFAMEVGTKDYEEYSDTERTILANEEDEMMANNCPNRTVDQTVRPNKSSILERAASYIMYLKKSNYELRQASRMLLKEEPNDI